MQKHTATQTELLNNPQWMYETTLEFALLTGATQEQAEKEALAAAEKVEIRNILEGRAA